MLCDNQKKAETLLQNREEGYTAVLKTIIIMDPFNSELVERGTKCGVDIVSLQDVEVMHDFIQITCTFLSVEAQNMFSFSTLQALGEKNLAEPIVSCFCKYFS